MEKKLQKIFAISLMYLIFFNHFAVRDNNGICRFDGKTWLKKKYKNVENVSPAQKLEQCLNLKRKSCQTNRSCTLHSRRSVHIKYAFSFDPRFYVGI